jgi:hypothetical protein
MRILPWLVAAVLAVSLWRMYSHRDVAHVPGILVTEDPRQRNLDTGAFIEHGAWRLKPRAEFAATVRILHREDYSLDELAELVPTDFAVGWGPMSDSAVLADVEITQGNRFYYWRTQHWPIARADIEAHSANWHVIPENDLVRASLDRARVGSLVEFRGQLVDVEGRAGRRTTSLVRTDTGAGACEILLATSAKIVGAR